MPPEPDFADAALRDAADALARRVLDRLPAAQAHGRAELAALSPPLARVLLARLDARVDREAAPPTSDWLDADRVHGAASAWRNAARQAGRVPARAWAGFLADACHLALSHIVRPAETLAAVAFEDDGPDERPTALLIARIAAVSPARFLPEIAGRYVERKGLTRLDRPALESLLRRIDRRMAESFTADEWADAVTQLSDLAGSDGVPYALTVALFDAKGQPEMARAFAGRGRQTPAEIRSLLASLLPAPLEPPAIIARPDVAHDADGRAQAETEDPSRAVSAPSGDTGTDAPASGSRDDAREGSDHVHVTDATRATEVSSVTPVADVPEPPSIIDVPDLGPEPPSISVPAVATHSPTSPLVTGRAAGLDATLPSTTDHDLDAWIGPSTPDAPATDRHDSAGPPPVAPSPGTPPDAPQPALPTSLTADTPLWQRYAPTPAPEPDATPALWKRFIPRSSGPSDAHLPSPPLAPPRAPLPPPGLTPAPGPRPPDPRPVPAEDALSGLDRLERAALGHPADDARRALYIADLFGGSEADYGKTLVTLARDASWTEASDTIARDVFRRHRVSPLSDAAVAFVDDVESRFRSA